MKTSIACVFILMLSLVSVKPAQACSCIIPPAPLVALGEAEAVFQGKVTRITRIPTDFGGENLAVFFDVDRHWKGDLGSRTAVQTATNSAACGYYFEKGEKYLVYAYTYEDGSTTLHTNICTRTTSLDQAAADILELGDGEGVRHRGCGSPFGSTVIQTFMFVGLAAVISRRRRSYSSA